MSTPPPTGPTLLRRFREQRHLSIYVAAPKAGLNKSYWSSVENGKLYQRGRQGPSRNWLLAAANGLDLNARERDELLAAFGKDPVEVNRAVAKLDEFVHEAGLTAKVREQILELTGLASESSGVASPAEPAHAPSPAVVSDGQRPLSPELELAVIAMAQRIQADWRERGQGGADAASSRTAQSGSRRRRGPGDRAVGS